jgi:uncharacterized protein (TIGR01777 family)
MGAGASSGARRVLISGASGAIGSAIVSALTAHEWKVVRLTRSAPRGPDELQWDPLRPVRPQTVSGFEAVVHLAGESIVGRWTGAKKARILESRVQGTRHLAEALAEAPVKAKVLICASAIGFYGDRGEETLREDSSPGAGFLPEVCQQWEGAAQPAEEAGIRTAHLRFGLVLTAQGGALPKMLTPFKLGLGGNVGNGRQWWSWIHIQDIGGVVMHVLNSELSGVFNLVAPNPVRNAEFTKTLAAVLGRPAIFPVPAFAARLAFGQMADELLLSSQRVEPAKLLAAGYQFRFRELKSALEEILKK